MSGDISAVSAHAASAAVESNTENASQSQNQKLQQDCMDVVRSSYRKSGNETVLNRSDAVEKLELLAKTQNDTTATEKLTQVADRIQNEPQSVANDPVQMKAVVSQVFNALSKTDPSSNVNVQANAANPFQAENPFGPKTIPPVIKANKAETDADAEGGEDAQKHKTPSEEGIFKRLSRFFN
jgi:hypothetical protein